MSAVNHLTESEQQVIINAVVGHEPMQMARAERLLAASVNFIEREVWEHAEVCNDEAIIILERVMHKIKENKKFLSEKLTN